MQVEECQNKMIDFACDGAGANMAECSLNGLLRVPALRKYGRPRSRPHLIDHIFGARKTIIRKTVLLSGA